VKENNRFNPISVQSYAYTGGGQDFSVLKCIFPLHSGFKENTSPYSFLEWLGSTCRTNSLKFMVFQKHAKQNLSFAIASEVENCFILFFF